MVNIESQHLRDRLFYSPDWVKPTPVELKWFDNRFFKYLHHINDV